MQEGASRVDTDKKPAGIAVALHYEHGNGAVPRVVASGHGQVAERIIAEAERTGVPVERNAALAKSLAALEIDQLIPPELYKAVAEVIGFLMRVSR